MRLFALLVAGLLAAASLLPAAAYARSQTVTITLSGPGSKPVTGAKIEIVDPQGNLLGSGITDDRGHAVIKFELPDGVDDVVIGTDAQGASGRRAYRSSYIRNAHPEQFGLIIFTTDSARDAPAVLALVKRAIAKCDKAEYDRWVAELDRRIAELEKEFDTAQAEADSFARENNLRVTDLKGARKDLARAQKAQSQIKDASLRNPAMLNALERYGDGLEAIEDLKKALDAARQARAAVPPFPEDCKKEKDKFGMAPGPGQCPDGSGGMLAGALNEVFDSDLAAACADRSRQRDIERPKKDRERDHRQRD